METGQTCRSIRSIPELGNHAEIATKLIQWAEASSEPLLFPGLLSGWPALTLWKGPAGLARLRKLAGDAEVQVMMSSSRVFFGDISRHQPAAIGFGQLLNLLESMSPPPPPSTASEPCLTQIPIPASRCAEAVAADAEGQGHDGAVEMQHSKGGRSLSITSGGSSSSSSSSSGSSGSSSSRSTTTTTTSTTSTGTEGRIYGQSGDSANRSDSRRNSAPPSGNGADGAHPSSPGGGFPLHAYLAQQPFSGGLESLQGDLPLPACLLGKDIASSNLWMCGGSVRSSLHYDPHHNLLVLVSGRKVVTIIPPYLTHCVYPMSLAGDAPNHSQVPFADTHPAARHPAYVAAVAAATVVELQAGDALFLPEGWWHQVNSGPEITIAVNYWWRSALTELLGGPAPAPLSAVQQPPSPCAQTKATRALVPSDASISSDMDAQQAESVALPQEGAARAALSPPRTAGAALLRAENADNDGSAPDLMVRQPPPPAKPIGAPAAGVAAGPAANKPARPSTTVLPSTSSPSFSEPGPGLRNLFALRQIAQAAIEDMVDALLATVGPFAPAPGVPVQDMHDEAEGITDATTTAVRHLSDAIRGFGAVGGAISSSDPSPMLSATMGSTPPLPPHVAGLIYHLHSDEASSLGLTGCPIAAAVSRLTPHQLATALYCMCRNTPDLVSKLLTRACRVPVVACLLTRAFDQLGTQPAAPECTATATGTTATTTKVVAAEVPSEQALAAPSTTAQDAGAVVEDPLARGLPGRRNPGGGEEGEEGVAAAAQTEAMDGLMGSVAGLRNPAPTEARVAEDGRGGDASLHDAGGVWIRNDLKREGGQDMEVGANQRSQKRQRCGDHEGCSVVEEEPGHSQSALNRNSRRGVTARDHSKGSPRRIEPPGWGGSKAPAVAAAVELGPYDAKVGAEDAGDSAVATSSSDFFKVLYGTVEDPDEVFRSLLQGRAALSRTARRILMDSVLS